MRIGGITVWDGVNDLGPSTLSWDGDRIEEVVPAPTDAHPGLAVIPGLIDTHVHLGGPAALGEEYDYTPSTWPLVTSREEQTLHAVAHAQRAMRCGVTTLRDMAGDVRQIAARDAFDNGLVTGPRLFVFGFVGMTAGHGDLATPTAVEAARRPPTADGPDGCRALVRAYARDGVDGIKFAASGGVASRGDATRWRNYTLAEIAALIDEAHGLGLPVAAHALTEEGIEVALAEGVDSLEHGTLITAEQAERAAERGVTLAPTLLTNDRVADGSTPVSPASRAKARALGARRDARLRVAREAGVPIVLGTDANGVFLPFGSALRELVRYKEVLAMTDAKALAAGTSEAAEALGAGDRLGRVAPEYGADFLVVKAQPWKDISGLAPENIVAVVCRGELVAGALPSAERAEPHPVEVRSGSAAGSAASAVLSGSAGTPDGGAPGDDEGRADTDERRDDDRDGRDERDGRDGDRDRDDDRDREREGAGVGSGIGVGSGSGIGSSAGIGSGSGIGVDDIRTAELRTRRDALRTPIGQAYRRPGADETSWFDLPGDEPSDARPRRLEVVRPLGRRDERSGDRPASDRQGSDRQGSDRQGSDRPGPKTP